MFKIEHFLIRAAFSALIVGLGTLSLSAQMTIFNIPSADTLQKRSVSFEADFIAKPTSYSNGGYQTYGYRVAYGLGHRTEIGSNFYYTRSGLPSVAEVQFSVKQNVYRNEKRGVSVSTGAIFFMPLRKTARDRNYGMVYANASKVFEPLHGLKVTGGVYSIVNGGVDFGSKTGALLAVEQPLSKRISFIADWYSGKNRFGYASGGLNYAITSHQYLLVGYGFGNSGRGNNALQAYYGYIF